MTGREYGGAVREAVALFDDVESLEQAIDELLEHGFDRADISLLATKSAVEEALGDEPAREIEDDARAPRTAYVSTESVGDAEGALVGIPMYVGAVTAAGLAAAAGGPLAVLIGAAVAVGGAGALLGGILARMLDDRRAEEIGAQLDRGGLVLWARVWTPEQEALAKATLAAHSGHDVHLHEMSAGGGRARRIAGGLDTPEAVLRASDLDRDEKIDLLRTFEYDAREMEVATEEGMREGEPGLLQRTLRALRALGEGPDVDHSSPTKHGGA